MNQKHFHLHVDATDKLDPALEQQLLDEYGFVPANFRHTPGRMHYEPLRHLTIEMDGQREFRKAFDRTKEFLQANIDGFAGYLEGELVAQGEETLPDLPYCETPIPFRAARINLKPGTFRKSEMHLWFDVDGTDPRVAQKLHEMGFHVGQMPFGGRDVEIHTIQGGKADIAVIYDKTREFLLRLGGMRRCTILEERIAAWWSSSRNIILPPVVYAILPA